VKDPHVRLVLDTTAVLAYAETSLHVGETIAEILDEGGRFGVPVYCLAEASHRVPEKHAEGVTLLTRHPQCEVLSTLADDWTLLAAFARALGRVDLAVALLEATDRPASYVLSGEPDAYGDDDMPVVGV
jgi:hypothetical protein